MPLALLQTAETMQALSNILDHLPKDTVQLIIFFCFIIFLCPYAVLALSAFWGARHVGGGLRAVADAIRGMDTAHSGRHEENVGVLTELKDSHGSLHKRFDGFETKLDAQGSTLQRIDITTQNAARRD